MTSGCLVAAWGATTAAAAKPLPERMADTGGGTQLITAVTNGTTNEARKGTLTWWRRDGSKWVKVGSSPARFGTNGLSGERVEGDGTTPTGLFTLPLTFGINDDPGSKLPWHSVDKHSWWDENPKSKRYNTWYQKCPKKVCWTASTRKKNASEHLADYKPQYKYAVFIGFNAKKKKVLPPDIGSGSGIFLHVSNGGYTAGCVSVKKSAMKALVRWLDPAASPHIAIGNLTTITSY
jgi:L,D-peptidoglycan transpeptidase YkuD (ErfK/YbiS/YcfS/YnhG family)